MKLLIAPFGRGGCGMEASPKAWPFWCPLITRLVAKGWSVEQISHEGDPPLNVDAVHWNVPQKSVPELLGRFDALACIDTWLHHAAHALGLPCAVVWVATDPTVYGYPEHVHATHPEPTFSARQYRTLDGLKAGMPPTVAWPGVEAVEKAIESLRPRRAQSSIDE